MIIYHLYTSCGMYRILTFVLLWVWDLSLLKIVIIWVLDGGVGVEVTLEG